LAAYAAKQPSDGNKFKGRQPRSRRQEIHSDDMNV